MKQIDTPSIHFNIYMTINEDSNWSHAKPAVDHNLCFSIPIELFSSKSVAEMIGKRVDALKGQFALEKLAFEEEEKAKEEVSN